MVVHPDGQQVSMASVWDVDAHWVLVCSQGHQGCIWWPKPEKGLRDKHIVLNNGFWEQRGVILVPKQQAVFSHAAETYIGRTSAL